MRIAPIPDYVEPSSVRCCPYSLYMRSFFSLLLLVVPALALRAAGGGDEVVVVYNTRVPESKHVAEYYAERRQVPAAQVLGFEVSTNEEISRTEFRQSLQQPLAKALEKGKLWHIALRTRPAGTNGPAQVEWKPVTTKVRYLVLCYGVPLKISPDPNLKEEATEKLRPELRRNEAAVDSELALLPLIEEHLPLCGPLRNPEHGTTNHFALSPTNGVLIVARLDGPSPEIARGLVDKALLAETDGLWGRAYFDLRNTTEPGYKLGDDWLRNAAGVSRHLGFETVVDENPATFPAAFPLSQVALYMGWYDEDVSGPFALPTVEFMPGAFAYHLHSHSAATIRSTTHHWVGPLLAKGAAATMGCVYEPYLSGTPDLGLFTARFIFSGFTFGEAACASQAVLSWQTTVVGDPLYRPFADNPDFQHDALLRRQSKLAEWSYLRLLNLNLAAGKPMPEAVRFLEQVDLTRKSAVLTEKLGDLYAAQGKPSSAAHAWAEALKLDPSPQQRVRLLLTLAEKLPALDREPEAYAAYQQLLETNPLYPDRVGIYKKLVLLAQKLHKPGDAQKYEAALNSALQGPKP